MEKMKSLSAGSHRYPHAPRRRCFAEPNPDGHVPIVGNAGRRAVIVGLSADICIARFVEILFQNHAMLSKCQREIPHCSVYMIGLF